MPGWLELAPYAALGLLGSLHCAGMCGPFALGVALQAGQARRAALGQALLYVLAKALGYALLGLVVARLAHLALHTGAALGSQADQPRLLESARAGLAWAAALVCLALALAALGVPLVPRAWRPRLAGGGQLPRILGALFASARALPGSARSFGLGLANAFLPCGLSWAALALALGATPALGALGLFTFGLATAPVLVAIGLFGQLVPPGARARLRPVAALLLVAFAVLTAARGGLTAGARALPACCAPAAASR